MEKSQLTKQNEKSNFEINIERLHAKAQQWISEIEFIKIEQNFLK